MKKLLILLTLLFATLCSADEKQPTELKKGDVHRANVGKIAFISSERKTEQLNPSQFANH